MLKRAIVTGLRKVLGLHFLDSGERMVRQRTASLFEGADARQFLCQSQLLEVVRGIDAPIVECGVGWGRSLVYWAALSRAEGRGRKVWGFDSFEGFPSPSPEDAGEKQPEAGRWRVPIEEPLRLLSSLGIRASVVDSQNPVPPDDAEVYLVKGFFDDTLERWAPNPIGLLSIDADLYRSYLSCLENLFPRVFPGGVVAFDEYHDVEGWPGARRAVDEYFEGDPPVIREDPVTQKCHMVKPQK